ncbi:MAG: hypothetical protein AB2795_09320 [Candidatus Thiodiazotropha endolucinida]
MPTESELDPCIICTSHQAETLESSFDGLHQKCPRCGEFKISGTAASIANQPLGKDKRAKISGWILEQNQSGALPMITSDNFQNIINRKLPSVAERATKLLIEADRSITNLGERFYISDPRFLAATYSSESKDVLFLLKFLEEQEFALSKALGGQCEILPQGYIHLDELKKRTVTSSQGFIAMWFHADLNNIFSKGFEAGIFNAGYNPVRIDQTEHINKIDDEIIRQINTSKFIVADFTGHRGGVYFEAGYAMGIDIPIFWTCRKDHLEDLHFDIRQFNCIDWESPEDLAHRLTTRIEAVLGPGPNK